MLSQETCQDQSTPTCSTPPSPLPNYAQYSSAPMKGVVPIKDIHQSINGLCHVSHSQDVDIPIHYPFTSPRSILGPYPSNQEPSNLPSILGPYSPPKSPNFPSILGPYIPSSPRPQDQQRYKSLRPSHKAFHINQSYQPSSSTSPKSFVSILDDQLKHKDMNPSSKVHYVSSNSHVNAKKENI